MQCYASRRSHEQSCAQAEFWGVISTLTHDLTKARNQLARLVKLAKPPGGPRRLFGGDCGSGRPLPPIRNYTPCAGSQLPNRHRLPLLSCGKQYPHYNDRPLEPRRPPCRPVTVCGATPLRPRTRSFGCGRSPQRPSWSFEQPQERVPLCREKEYRYSQEYSRAPYSCERQESKPCGRSRPSDSYCVQICINPYPPAAPRPPCVQTPSPCRGGSGPARLQGGRGRDCIATQFAALLQDVTCQLRERRLAAAAEGRF